MKQDSIFGEAMRTVKIVTPLAEYKLLLEFEDGDKRIYDIAPLLGFGDLALLTDTAIFQQVHIMSDNIIGWDGILDICPDCLYEHSIQA